MPNWTANNLELSGSKEATQRFLDMMGAVFDFQKIIPMPKILASFETKDLTGEDLLAAQEHIWGTERNACHCKPVEVEERDGTERTLVYRFDSVSRRPIFDGDTRGTPAKIILKIAEDWPDLKIGGGWIDGEYDHCGSFNRYVLGYED